MKSLTKENQFVTENSLSHCKAMNLMEEFSDEIPMGLVVQEVRLG